MICMVMDEYKAHAMAHVILDSVGYLVPIYLRYGTGSFAGRGGLPGGEVFREGTFAGWGRQWGSHLEYIYT